MSAPLEQVRERSQIVNRPGGKARLAVLAGCGLLALGLGIWRIFSITPGELDGPGTLRPLIATWFRVFIARYPNVQIAELAWRNYFLLSLLLPVALALANFWLSTPSAATRRKRLLSVICSRPLFIASFILPLVIVRLPTTLGWQLNVDESQFLVAAEKLFKDPVYFRAVDCGTAGPVTIYPLMLPALFGFVPDYASGRIVGLVMTAVTLWLLYRTLALLTEERLARIAMLPAAGVFAVLNRADFVEYGSELPTLVIVAGALYAAVRIMKGLGRLNLWAAALGFFASLSFFSKMQSLPLIAAIMVVVLAYVFATARTQKILPLALYIGAGAVPLFALNAAIAVATGVWGDFWTEYIDGNRDYVETVGGDVVQRLPSFLAYVFGISMIRLLLFTLIALIAARAYYVWKARNRPETTGGFFLRLIIVSALVISSLVYIYQATSFDKNIYLVILCAIGILLYLLIRIIERPHVPDAGVWFNIMAWALIAAGLYAVYVPNRQFEHYLILLLLPVSAAIAGLLVLPGSESHKGPGVSFIVLFVTMTLSFEMFVAAWETNSFSAFFAKANEPMRTSEGNFIRSISPQGATLEVWGWNTTYYLLSGRLPATRDTNMYNFFFAGPQINEYHRARFLKEMEQTPPEVFVDATGPSSCCGLEKTSYGIESVPAVAAFIASRYSYLVTGSYQERYFLRNDLARVRDKNPGCGPNPIRCFDTSNRDTANPLGAVNVPDKAVILADFTPDGSQDSNVTVFSNAPSTESGQGFQLQSTGGDKYRLAVGLGDGKWAYSRELEFPPGRMARLSIAMDGTTLKISSDGVPQDSLQLPKRMADSQAGVSLGSAVGGDRPFKGKIHRFEIRGN